MKGYKVLLENEHGVELGSWYFTDEGKSIIKTNDIVAHYPLHYYVHREEIEIDTGTTANAADFRKGDEN